MGFDVLNHSGKSPINSDATDAAIDRNNLGDEVKEECTGPFFSFFCIKIGKQIHVGFVLAIELV